MSPVVQVISQTVVKQPAIKLREYQHLWLQIAQSDTPIIVTCQESFRSTLIQAVRKEKTIANVHRKMFDLPRYGRLFAVIEKLPAKPGKVRVTFSLDYNGDRL